MDVGAIERIEADGGGHRNRVKPWRNEQGMLIVGSTDFLTDPALIDA
ncbi:hypothetical protein [Curtanaerobium respiraculi]|nr:hypothetical protein [Curtanaerobium respiraculi]